MESIQWILIAALVVIVSKFIARKLWSDDWPEH